MILIKALEVRNYKALKHANLGNMNDLNILIGPSNCGKTSILSALSLAAKLNGAYSYSCQTCQRIAAEAQISAVGCNVPESDKYMRPREVVEETEICFSFNENEVEKLVPRVLAKVRSKVDAAEPGHCIDEVRMKWARGGLYLITEHISPFCHPDIIELLNSSILSCPEQRLQSYKEKPIQQYISDKKLPGARLRKWEDFLRRLVDPTVIDHAYNLDLIRNINGINFQTSLDEQGSGVRSVACLAADLIFEDKAKIILIDEPELGLNPFSKQEFLRLLLDQSKERQIFIATHDPTLVNPVLWRKQNVAVFSYSPFISEFVKVNLEESRKAPENFAGCLPHTVSLREIQVYVEGASDVYILQVFLRKYCRQNYENWLEMINKVGIFHLGGDFWPHLLYTVPEPPYRCVIVLDGDKKAMAENVCQRYDEVMENVSRFELAENIENLANIMARDDRHPVYCLKEKCIEEYLEPKPPYEQPGYRKSIDGPRIAEDMEQVPEEIQGIIEAVLKGA